MLKIKILGTLITAILLGLFVTQVNNVNAQSKTEKRTVTGPITSPITGPCKPGWGWGDKNHCHSGPQGHNKEHKEYNEQKQNNGHKNR